MATNAKLSLWNESSWDTVDRVVMNVMGIVASKTYYTTTLQEESAFSRPLVISLIINNQTYEAVMTSTLVARNSDVSTYDFESGDNGFLVTKRTSTGPRTDKITVNIPNNITGQGTTGTIPVFATPDTIESGISFGGSTSTFLRNDGTWAAPSDGKLVITLDPVSTTSSGMYFTPVNYTVDELVSMLVQTSSEIDEKFAQIMTKALTSNIIFRIKGLIGSDVYLGLPAMGIITMSSQGTNSTSLPLILGHTLLGLDGASGIELQYAVLTIYEDTTRTPSPIFMYNPISKQLC